MTDARRSELLTVVKIRRVPSFSLYVLKQALFFKIQIIHLIRLHDPEQRVFSTHYFVNRRPLQVDAEIIQTGISVSVALN